MIATIHYARIGKPTAIYHEGLIEDDGLRLSTHSVVPRQYSETWSERWQHLGLLKSGQLIGTVGKYYFYQEYFDILELHDPQGGLLGHYCDIATPLQRIGDDYYITDLFLDLWLTPDRAARELDWDEFDAAIEAGLISLEQQETVRRTLKRLRQEVVAGRFPHDYIR